MRDERLEQRNRESFELRRGKRTGKLTLTDSKFGEQEPVVLIHFVSITLRLSAKRREESTP